MECHDRANLLGERCYPRAASCIVERQLLRPMNTNDANSGLPEPVVPPRAESIDRKLGMVWRTDEQIFYCANDVFHKKGRAKTHPSHDLAHLLVAASGNLPWKPTGNDTLRRLAEYNAVFIEHLLDAAFNCVAFNTMQTVCIFPHVHSHAKWFVEEHYRPFPISAESAYRKFCQGINAPIVVALSPYFFFQKREERINPDSGLRHCEIAFSENDAPVTEGEALLFQDLVRDLLSNIESR
jgi:hypothetical protein